MAKIDEMIADLRRKLNKVNLPVQVENMDGSWCVCESGRTLVIAGSRFRVDAALIAAAVNALPALLNELERLRADPRLGLCPDCFGSGGHSVGHGPGDWNKCEVCGGTGNA